MSLLAQGACSRTNDPSQNLSRLMEQYHEIGQFDGSALVARAGSVVFERGLGEANREWGNLNDTDTKFRLGSVTKSITATLTLRLIDECLLDLSGTVSSYLPEFREDVGSKVTVHQLLTHSSGIPLPQLSMDDYWDLFQRRLTTEEIVRTLCSEDVRFEPGERFQYSSAGYMILGAIIERVTGQTYAEALRERVLHPAGMLGTGVDDPELILPHRATGYQTNWGLGTARYKYMPSSFSSGSLYSTVDDLYRWNRAIDSGLLLSDEARRLMFTRHLEIDREYTGYGWFLDSWQVGDTVMEVAYHGGDVSGFSAFVLRTLDSGDLVVLLSNQEGLKYNEIALNLLRVLHDQPAIPPKPYVADLLRHAVLSGGLDRGRQVYGELRSRGLDQYDIDEDELLELGEDLAAVGRIAEARAVLEIAVELHPSSLDSLTSLAEAQLESGDLDGAASSSRRALELEPDNPHAAAMLENILGQQPAAGE
jgi:CubicO group peptidase (beta-lactamase class C family)